MWLDHPTTSSQTNFRIRLQFPHSYMDLFANVNCVLHLNFTPRLLISNGHKWMYFSRIASQKDTVMNSSVRFLQYDTRQTIIQALYSDRLENYSVCSWRYRSDKSRSHWVSSELSTDSVLQCLLLVAPTTLLWDPVAKLHTLYSLSCVVITLC